VFQWPRLAAVSPKLLAIYCEDGSNLDQMMAFGIPEPAISAQDLAELHRLRSAAVDCSAPKQPSSEWRWIPANRIQRIVHDWAASALTA